MSKLPAKHRKRLGFTLVELVIVIIIIGIVSAIALPRFANASARQQLSTAATRVIADLELARTRARAASQTVSVTFDTTNDQYQFNNIGGEATLIDLGESPYRVSIDTARFGDSKIASFNGYGVTANSGVVTLSNSSGQVTVKLNANGEARR